MNRKDVIYVKQICLLRCVNMSSRIAKQPFRKSENKHPPQFSIINCQLSITEHSQLAKLHRQVETDVVVGDIEGTELFDGRGVGVRRTLGNGQGNGALLLTGQQTVEGNVA